MFNVFMWVVSGFGFALSQGKKVYYVAKKIISLPFYKTENARRAYLTAGGSLALTAYFAPNTYSAIAHMVVDEDADLTFTDAIAAYTSGDLSLAEAGSNYLTGYGSVMLIFIGISAVELVPVARVASLGIKNPTKLLYNERIRKSIMSKFKHIDFDTMQTILASRKFRPGLFKKTNVNMPVNKQKELYDAIHTYFGKLKSQSKIKNPKTKNVRPDKVSNDTFKKTIIKIKDNKYKAGGAGLAATAIFSLFIHLWLAENDTDGNESIVVADISKMYKLCSTVYNRFYQNPIMSSDIRSYSTVHKVKSVKGYGSFIELHMLGRKIIETWYDLRDDGKPLFAKYLEVILIDITKILDGKLQNGGIVPQIVGLLLKSINNGNVEEFLKLLTLGIIEDDAGQNKVYTGVAREGISVKRLLTGFGSTNVIKDLLSEIKVKDKVERSHPIDVEQPANSHYNVSGMDIHENVSPVADNDVKHNSNAKNSQDTTPTVISDSMRNILTQKQPDKVAS